MTESLDSLVLSELRGNVLVLTWNRPERLNGWTDTLEDQYFALLAKADADPDVRVVVVTGAGRGFCAGADMDQLQSASENALSETGNRLPKHTPLFFRKPLIAAVNGAAAGLGLVEALYCDVRFSVPSAKFTSAFARRGLVAEYGLAWLLPRVVGAGRAFDLLLSARVIMGEEAYRIGLVDFLVEPDELLDRAVAYAVDIATYCSPTATGIIKSQVHEAFNSGFASAAVSAEQARIASFDRPDVAEGVQSYLERRPPRFPPLGQRAGAWPV